MNITMTKAEALKIQAEHVAWYAPKYAGNLAEVVAKMTTADQLEDNVQYPIITINEMEDQRPIQTKSYASSLNKLAANTATN